MKKIEIVTAINGLFSQLAIKTSTASKRMGYHTRIFSIDDTFIGFEKFKLNENHRRAGRSSLNGESVFEKERIVGVAPWKPSVMLHVLSQELDPEKIIVWLDADAWVVNSLDDLHNYDFDIAFTMRRPEERGRSDWPEVYGYINAGFVAMRATPATMAFLKRWQFMVETTPSKSDQHAANLLVRKCTDFTEYNKTFSMGDAWVRILKTDEYNNYYLPDKITPDVRVIHMKKDVRERENVDVWIERTHPFNLRSEK